MKKNKSINILCTGAGGASGHSMLRSLQECDLNVRLFAGDMNKYSSFLSRSGVKIFNIPSASTDPDLFKKELLTLCIQKKIDILICSPESEVLIMSKLIKNWKRKFGIEVVTTYPETARIGVNKYELYKKLKHRKELNIMPMRPVFSKKDLKSWSFGFPCVLKPFDGVSARGVHYINNQKELELVYKYLKNYLGYNKILIQKMIVGPVKNIFTVGALFWKGNLINAGIHHKLRTSPPTGGSAVVAVTYKPDHLLQYGLNILHASGKWHGFVAAEFKVSEIDRKPYLLEINPRLWGFSYLMTMAGVNYPELLIRIIMGEKILNYSERGKKLLIYKIGKKMIRSLDLMDI